MSSNREKEEKPHWRAYREKALKGKKRIRYNWEWRDNYRFAALCRLDVSSDLVDDGWRN